MENTHKTDKKFVYFGTVYEEEYYLSLENEDIRGWSFMGLRPQTEGDLRKYARDIEPEVMLGIDRDQFNSISNYFDYEKFADDMEEDWLENHDTQAEREDETGETLYLGFGSGQDIFGYFTENKINSFADYENHFDETGLNEETINKVLAIIKKYKNRNHIKPVGDEQEKKIRRQEKSEMNEALKEDQDN